MRVAWVYILTNHPNGTLYIGVTTDLPRRIAEHKSGSVAGFTSRYGLDRLVYAEQHDDVRLAIRRERTMKTWRRAWKVRLICAENPEWKDLSTELT